MDWGIIGLIDLILVLLILIMGIVGYKKGFLKKAIGLVSFFVALVVALVFCKQFANFLKGHDIIYGGLYDTWYLKFSEVEAIQMLESSENLANSLNTELNIPKFLCDSIANSILSNVSAQGIVEKLTTAVADLLMVIISACLLFVIVFVGAFILKIIVHILRGNAIIKCVDGIIGIVFYVSMLLLFVCFVFAVFYAMRDKEFFQPVQQFLITDLQLETDKFRLSKAFYEHNPIVTIFEWIF